MRGVLSGERDDPAGSFHTQTGEMLVCEFLGGISVLGVVYHALGEDSGADHDRLPGYLAGNPLNVLARAPINLFHVSLGVGQRAL
jgi:hypothetical protein